MPQRDDHLSYPISIKWIKNGRRIRTDPKMGWLNARKRQGQKRKVEYIEVDIQFGNKIAQVPLPKGVIKQMLDWFDNPPQLQRYQKKILYSKPKNK